MKCFGMRSELADKTNNLARTSGESWLEEPAVSATGEGTAETGETAETTGVAETAGTAGLAAGG